MNITENVISDLLPQYAAHDCSADTRRLIEEYLQNHPQFASRVQAATQDPLPGIVPGTPGSGDEMRSLTRTKLLLKQRTYFMAFAIFCSLAPFSVLHTHGRTYWLLVESPVTAAAYGVAAVFMWAGYLITRRKLTRSWS